MFLIVYFVNSSLVLSFHFVSSCVLLSTSLTYCCLILIIPVWLNPSNHSTMLSHKAKQDKLVRATDIDALSCRYSADRKGYFVPPDAYIADLIKSYERHLTYCEGYTPLSAGRTLRSSFTEGKFPLINRGTYFRTVAINRVVDEFVKKYPESQIVSLGGGSDTRCFRVLKGSTAVNYVEIDFPESAKIKKLAISQNPALQNIVGVQMEPLSIDSREHLANMDSDLHSEKYHLLGLDLRTLDVCGEEKLAFLDRSAPTLVISECVLCYLTPEDNDKVLTFWKNYMTKVSVLVYEPMALGDAFGETMALNLLNRGIDLQTFHKYPDLKSRQHLFTSLGFDVKLTDMALMGGYSDASYSWMDTKELARVSRLEMIDEVEEIRLLLQHYCLIYAESGCSVDAVIQLRWLM